jgi:SsrA-binding protein
MTSTSSIKVISRNRQASHEYHLTDTYQAGMVLMGSEIKSIRDNRINLKDGFVVDRDNELWLYNVHISPYEKAANFGHVDPVRPRKLLLHRKEIAQIISRIRERGFTVVPTMVFLERGRAKIEIAIGKGKKEYDKRASIAQRDADRDIRRALKGEE